MSDKEQDINAIELKGCKKYIVEQLESAEEELQKLKSGFFSRLGKSNEISGFELYIKILEAMLKDVNKRIERHVS